MTERGVVEMKNIYEEHQRSPFTIELSRQFPEQEVGKPAKIEYRGGRGGVK